MSQIVKCRGEGCLLAFRCKRFTAYCADNNSPFFADAPYKVVDGVLSCAMFWGEEQDSIYGQLKDIVNGEDNTGRTTGDDIGGAKETKQRT